MQSDFIKAGELSKLTGFSVHSFYNQHARQCGPMSSILTKLGGKLGAWRLDYEVWMRSQRRLTAAAVESAEA